MNEYERNTECVEEFLREAIIKYPGKRYHIHPDRAVNILGYIKVPDEEIRDSASILKQLVIYLKTLAGHVAAYTAGPNEVIDFCDQFVAHVLAHQLGEDGVSVPLPDGHPLQTSYQPQELDPVSALLRQYGLTAMGEDTLDLN
jgi:hypothetical protein